MQRCLVVSPERFIRWVKSLKMQDTNRQNIIRELVQWMKIDRGIVVPFLGAGISRSLGLPSWRELAEQILETAENFQVFDHDKALQVRELSPLEILTACRQALGDVAFQRQITTKLSKREDRISSIAQLSWLINTGLVVTTNLDKTIEEAGSTSVSGHISSLTPRDPLGVQMARGGRSVLHLHGVVDRYDTWIMTETDYESAIDPLSPNGAVLTALLTNKVLLFLGYGCNDIDFNYFLFNIATNFPKGSVELYAFLPRLNPSERMRLLSIGVTPIEYPPTANPEPEIVQFLQGVLTAFDPLATEEQLRSIDAFSLSQNLSSPSELKQMTSSQRREKIGQEFKHLFAANANASLSSSTALPNAIAQRRSDILDILAGAWQVGVIPPYNGIYGREVIESIGRGGFGEVFLVETFQNRSRQALKVAHFQETSNLKFVERFRQGIKAMKRLSNQGVKNITHVVDDYEVPLCVFMDYYEGGDLGSLIQNTDYGLDDRLRLGLEISEIIAEAHSHKVYHRDLKPSNVLVDYRDDGLPHAILTDFDLAWFEGALSRTTTRMGDHAFASPEQLKEARGNVQVRASSDAYSLGMLLFFLIKKSFPPPGQWMNMALENDVYTATEKQCVWKSAAVEVAKLIKRCSDEKTELRPEAFEVVGKLRTIWEAESTGSSESLFVPEIRHRVCVGIYPSLSLPKGLSIEVRRLNNQDVVQAAFAHIREGSESWGDFPSQATKHVNGLLRRMQDRGWRLVSRAANAREGRLTVARDIDDWRIESVYSIVSSLQFGIEAWANWI